MGPRPGDEPALPRVNVGEGIDPGEWGPLPEDDRVLVGGHTVWSGPFHPPVVVPQPNRWGVIESRFPDVACLVEADAEVTGSLPLPRRVVGFVDRAHRPIERPPTGTGAELIEKARRLAGALSQIKGVGVAARPFARTIPLLVPAEGTDLIGRCRQRGVEGMRLLPGIGGGVALSAREEHRKGDLEQIVDAVRAAVEG